MVRAEQRVCTRPLRRAFVAAALVGLGFGVLGAGLSLAGCTVERPDNRIEAPLNPDWWRALAEARKDGGAETVTPDAASSATR